MPEQPVLAWLPGESAGDAPVTRFQGHLAGSAVALLLAAHIAMELLHAYPVNQYLWHVNIIFAREARPLLQHIDALADGRSTVTILGLGAFALLCVAAGHARIWLLAAVNSHVVLTAFLFLGARSYMRTYPYGLPDNGTLVSLATEVSVVQFGIAAFVVALAFVCVRSHIDILGRGLAFASRRGATSWLGSAASGGLAISRVFEVGLALLGLRQGVRTGPKAP